MISAVVLTWNSARYIEGCLGSLAADAHRTGIELELFVVDGGSSDGTPEILYRLAKEIPGLRTIQLGKNLGTTVSRNIAIRESRGEYILILDSDTEVLPGALGTLCKALEEAPRAGIAAPRLLYPDGSVQPSCKRFPTAPLKICKFAPVSLIQRLGEKAELYPHEVYSKDFKEIVCVDYCISACWLVKREAIEAVGLLDERIFYAPEDVDYCLRMWLAGWEVLYVPSAEVVHHTQRRSYKSLR
ncbi:MAG: glycosyltransferase family 2 protein, partial [Armatimonadota bacterium]